MQITIWNVIIIIILSIFIFAVIVYFFFMFSSFLRKTAPYIWTFHSQFQVMKKNLEITKWSKVVDLWCGDGKALRFFAKNYNLSQLDWVDINKFAILRWKLLNKILFTKNINLKNKDFFSVKLKNYNYIYLYLFPEQMQKLEARIFSESNKWTIIIANSFTFHNKKPFQIFYSKNWKKVIFIYKV